MPQRNDATKVRCVPTLADLRGRLSRAPARPGRRACPPDPGPLLHVVQAAADDVAPSPHRPHRPPRAHSTLFLIRPHSAGSFGVHVREDRASGACARQVLAGVPGQKWYAARGLEWHFWDASPRRRFAVNMRRHRTPAHQRGCLCSPNVRHARECVAAGAGEGGSGTSSAPRHARAVDTGLKRRRGRPRRMTPPPRLLRARESTSIRRRPTA
jgi:hypothetical protein